jgi:hypothetical protein
MDAVSPCRWEILLNSIMRFDSKYRQLLDSKYWQLLESKDYLACHSIELKCISLSEERSFQPRISTENCELNIFGKYPVNCCSPI